MPVVIDYFDEHDANRVLKRLVQSDIREVGNVPTAMKMVMYNKNDNTSTEMEMIEIKYNMKIEDSIFTERGLKQ